jgi:polyferredoxin
MTSPPGWREPGQRPEFLEVTVVLQGAVHVEHEGGSLTVEAGQAVVTLPGEWVRYSTPNGMRLKLTAAAMVRRVLRPRVLVYTAVLLTVSVILMMSLFMRTPFKVDVVRDRGAMARMVGQGQIENVYRLQIMNATEKPQQYDVSVSVSGLPGAHLVSPSAVLVEAAASRWVALRVQAPGETASAGSHSMIFLITGAGGQGVLAEKSSFLVPR